MLSFFKDKKEKKQEDKPELLQKKTYFLFYSFLLFTGLLLYFRHSSSKWSSYSDLTLAECVQDPLPPIGLMNLVTSMAIHTYDLCEDPKASFRCKDNIGIPRSIMPQFSKEIMNAFINDINQQGYIVSEKILPATCLTPIQNQIRTDKVVMLALLSKIFYFDSCNSTVLVIFDALRKHNFILDGTHRSLACEQTGGLQRLIIIEGDVNEILHKAYAFPGVIYDTSFFSVRKDKEKRTLNGSELSHEGEMNGVEKLSIVTKKL